MAIAIIVAVILVGGVPPVWLKRKGKASRDSMGRRDDAAG